MSLPFKSSKSGFAIPVFGIGTWHMGGSLEKDNSDDKKWINAIKMALDAGITHIDTAEIYGNGHAEELVAQAIKDYDRSKLFITSKVFKPHLSYKDVIASCKASLGRIGTDYLDLYLIHAPNPEIPIKETLKAFDELKEQGLIKNIGVSNFSVEQLKEAQDATKNPIVTNQIHYSIPYRTWEDVVDYCQKNDILITAYRPVERGALTEPGIPVVDRMCEKYKKTPAQIAINWLISQPNVVTIAKMSTPEHLKENLGALGWEMTKDDLETLRNEFPPMELPKGMIKFGKII